DRVFHAALLRGGVVGADPGSNLVREGGPHVDGHPVAAGVLHRAQVQDLGAVRRHLQRLLAGDVGDLAGRGDDAGVRGEQAVDVGVDLADVRVERGGEGDGGGV